MNDKKKVNSNIAYDYLYNAIIKHELEPGQAIIEQNISDLLGISRTPVRVLEALKNRDGAEAERRLLKHLTNVKDSSIRACQNRRFGI